MKLLLAIVLFSTIGNCCFADEPKQSPGIMLKEVSVTQAAGQTSVTLVVFSEREFTIRVIDNAGKNDAAKFPTLAKAMEFHNCIAGCNGGFFDRHPFSPVGGMISAGRRTSAVDPNIWMKGLLVVRGGHPTLELSESFQDKPEVTELLQSGTWLVRAGVSETDSSRNQIARRTFICHDGKGTWAIGASERCTLHELATILKSPEVTAILNIQEALNFDGGPSTGLWLKQATSNFYLPEKWAVRNFIGIFPNPTQ